MLDFALRRLAIAEPSARVVAASLAEPAMELYGPTGDHVVFTTSGNVRSMMVILQFDDGTRRLQGVTCDIRNVVSGGSLTADERGSSGDLEATREGREPWR